MTDAEHKPRYVLLDAVHGWRTLAESGVQVDAHGALRLQSLPGSAAELLSEQAAQQAGLHCPAGIAIDHCGTVWASDSGSGRMFRVDPDSRRVAALPALGGRGSTPGLFATPRGLAIRATGGLAVADTGNRRVQVFSDGSYVLTQLWQELPTLGEGAGETLGSPSSVALDPCDNLYIGDRVRGCIWRLERGRRFAQMLGAGELIEPQRIALSRNGLLAVADTGARSVFLFRVGAKQAHARLSIGDQQPCSVAFGRDDTLYVGDGIGLIHVFTAHDAEPGGYVRTGSGDTRITGAVLDLAYGSALGLIALIREDREGNPRRLWQIDPAGGCASAGTWTSDALSSSIAGCQWHRIGLRADFTGPQQSSRSAQPGVASIEIKTYTADDIEAGRAAVAADAAQWRAALLSGDADPDCLVQSAAGKYLWLRLELRSNGEVSPRIHAARIHFPRRSYLQYLPAVYQEDRASRLFLERFLAIFQTGFDALDELIGALWMLFDPAATRREFLLWLAQWVGLQTDPQWSTQQLRDMIGKAHARHLIRGTAVGIRTALCDYAGVDAVLLEHFKLREWTILWNDDAALDGSRRLWSRDFYRQLQLGVYSQIGSFQLAGSPEPAIESFDWGAHRFTVFFAADPGDAGATRQRVAAIVEREKPAHAQAELCPVYPRMRVGRQAMIGVDARIGAPGALALGSLATLGYDSILGCSREELALRSQGAAPRPRVGASTRLH